MWPRSSFTAVTSCSADTPSVAFAIAASAFRPVDCTRPRSSASSPCVCFRYCANWSANSSTIWIEASSASCIRNNWLSSATAAVFRSVAVVGGSGRDTYIGSTAGDTFYGAGNVDALILEPGKAVRDTVVLKSATDSQWIASQANNGAYITLDNDRTEIDFVLNFSTAADATGDRLDLTGFGFTGAQRGLANVSARIGGTTSLNQLTDLFATPAGNRGAVYAVYGNDTFVFIDANKDGNFTVEADVAIQLAGVNAFSETSINF